MMFGIQILVFSFDSCYYRRVSDAGYHIKKIESRLIYGLISVVAGGNSIQLCSFFKIRRSCRNFFLRKLYEKIIACWREIMEKHHLLSLYWYTPKDSMDLF